MELKDFVEETLRQIIDGVRAAQEYGKQHGAFVNPKSLTFRTDQGFQLYDPETGAISQQIQFDVALTVIEGKQTRGGIGVVAGPIALGSQGKSDASNTTVSRIQFMIPLMLPRV